MIEAVVDAHQIGQVIFDDLQIRPGTKREERGQYLDDGENVLVIGAFETLEDIAEPSSLSSSLGKRGIQAGWRSGDERGEGDCSCCW